MARKPAPLELAGGKGPRQRIWDMIRAHRDEFSHLDVLPAGVDTRTASTYLQSLLRGGFVAEHGTREIFGGRHLFTFRLVRDVGAEAPRIRRDGTPVTQGMAQEQMWRTLRMNQGDINARELAAHAGTPRVAVSPAAAGDYLRNLHRAAYLVCTTPGKGTGNGGIQARYRLANNTGPRPPMVCRAHAIYDPNLARVTWTDETITEEDAIYGN